MVEIVGAKPARHIDYENKAVCENGQCTPFDYVRLNDQKLWKEIQENDPSRRAEVQPLEITGLKLDPTWRPRTMDGPAGGDQPELRLNRDLLQLDTSRGLGDIRIRRSSEGSIDTNDVRTWFKQPGGNQFFGMGDNGTLGLRGRGLGTSDLLGQRDPLSSLLNPNRLRFDRDRDLSSAFDRTDLSQLFRPNGLRNHDSLFSDPLRLRIEGQNNWANDPNWKRNPDALLALSKHYDQMKPEAQEYFKKLVDDLGMRSTPLLLEDLRVVTPKPEGGQPAGEKPPGEQPAAEKKPPVEKKPAETETKEGEKPPEQVKPNDPTLPADRPMTPEEFEAASLEGGTEKLDALGQAVKDSGAFTIGNFAEAYREAAKNGSGIAIMVVGRDIPGSQEAVKNIKALQEKNPNLKFLVVDRDKVNAAVQADPNNAKMKEWQSWIDNSLKSCGGKKEVLTSIQSLTADASGHPKPEKVTSHHWNNPNLSEEIAAKASLASDATAGHAKEFKLSLTAADAKTLATEIEAARKAAFDAPMTDLATMRARQEKYVRAMQLASQARPDLMAQRLKDIAQIQDQTERDKQLEVYDQLSQAQALLRAELGLDMVRNANRMPKPEQKLAMLSAGTDLLRDVYGRSNDLDRPENAPFVDAMRAAGVKVEELKKNAASAPRLSSEQVLQRLEQAYGVQKPVQAERPRAEYSCDSGCVQQCRGCMPCGQQARGECYRRYGCGQGQGSCGQQGRPAGRIIRRFFGR